MCNFVSLLESYNVLGLDLHSHPPTQLHRHTQTRTLYISFRSSSSSSSSSSSRQQQQQAAAAGSSSRQQQQQAAAGSSRQQQQAAAAAGSSSRQQQAAAAGSSSRQQQQAAAGSSSRQQQQQQISALRADIMPVGSHRQSDILAWFATNYSTWARHTSRQIDRATGMCLKKRGNCSYLGGENVWRWRRRGLRVKARAN